MTTKSILLLSGPNLDLLGTREPGIYGSDTLADHVATARSTAESTGFDLVHLQSASEADLVAAVHAAGATHAAIVINAGALTHYGWALRDALASYPGVIVELHLSNPDRREPWRHTSVITPVASAYISGFRGFGYKAAVEGAISLLR